MSEETSIGINNVLLTLVIGISSFIAFKVWEINSTLAVVAEKQAMQEQAYVNLYGKVERINDELWNLKTKIR